MLAQCLWMEENLSIQTVEMKLPSILKGAKKKKKKNHISKHKINIEIQSCCKLSTIIRQSRFKISRAFVLF